jgi:peptidoglycan/xylan/chitin deacetylase (PgdA/CDA1 family)
MAWVNSDNLTSLKRRDVVSKGTNGDYEWSLSVNSNKQPVFIIFNTESNNYLTATGRTILKEGKWYHLAGSFDGTKAYVYTNGILEAISSKTAGRKAFTGKARIFVGSRETIGGDTPFSGLIDDVLIYNISLDAKEIRRIYNESIYGSNLGIGIPVLSYHEIKEKTDAVEIVSPSNFLEQMKYLANSNYNTITYDDYYNFVRGKANLPEKPIIIVFDDGYNSVWENAYPIMKNYGFKGVFGIITNRVGNSGYVGWVQLNTLKSEGWQIASHSENHLDMTSLSAAKRESEFANSKNSILKNTSIIPSLFIFPFNRNNDTLDRECSNFYLMCNGYSSGPGTFENFLFQKANLTYEEGSPVGMRRITVKNDTSLENFKSAIDYQDELVGWWKFNETAGGNIAYDYSSYRNNMNLYNVIRI